MHDKWQASRLRYQEHLPRIYGSHLDFKNTFPSQCNDIWAYKKADFKIQWQWMSCTLCLRMFVVGLPKSQCVITSTRMRSKFATVDSLSIMKCLPSEKWEKKIITSPRCQLQFGTLSQAFIIHFYAMKLRCWSARKKYLGVIDIKENYHHILICLYSLYDNDMYTKGIFLPRLQQV